MKPIEIKTGRLIYSVFESKTQTIFTISDGNYWAFDVLPDDLSKLSELDILKLVLQSKNDSVFEILDRLELVGCILDGVLIDRFKCKELIDGLH